MYAVQLHNNTSVFGYYLYRGLCFSDFFNSIIKKNKRSLAMKIGPFISIERAKTGTKFEIAKVVRKFFCRSRINIFLN